MWQKLNRIDIYELEKVRIQLVNAIQLISAAPRSYLSHTQEKNVDWLYWGSEESSINSTYFGGKEKVKVSLDIERFVISIFGKNDHVEHLVLSGMTYPMAYGWMKIKLDSFHLNGNKFNDGTTYSIERYLSMDEEMNMTNQSAIHDLTLYYSNANYLFNQLKHELNGGDIRISPKDLRLMMMIEYNENKISFGFAPGDKDFPEPCFFITLHQANNQLLQHLDTVIGIPNSRNWHGLVFLSSEFLSLDPTVEMDKVKEFFKLNLQRIFDS